MSNIQALSFTENVEANRQALIRHCRANGIDVDDRHSLSTIVGYNNSIANPVQEGKHSVIFYDLDNNIVGTVMYVNKGGTVTPPPAPNFDSELLEFIEWEHNGDFNNVQEDIICYPVYQTRVNEEGYRPSVIKMYLTPDILTVGIHLYSSSYQINCKIDWGDGSPIKDFSNDATTLTHTYTIAGAYAIKIWGEQYCISDGIFGYSGDALKNAVSSIYLSNDINISSLIFKEYYGLKYLLLPMNNKYFFTRLNGYFISNCKALKNIVLPKTIERIEEYVFQECKSLKYIMIPENVEYIKGEYVFSGCNNIERIIVKSNKLTSYDFINQTMHLLKEIPIKDNITFNKLMLYNCYSIKNLIFTDNIIIKDLRTPNSSFLEYIKLPKDIDCYIEIGNFSYTKENLIQIIKDLKDNSSASVTRTLRMTNGFRYDMYTLKIGDINLIEYAQNKNWTVGFLS